MRYEPTAEDQHAAWVAEAAEDGTRDGWAREEYDDWEADMEEDEEPQRLANVDSRDGT